MGAFREHLYLYLSKFQKNVHGNRVSGIKDCTMATAKTRDGRGRFLPGNPGGPGNPEAARVARLRAAVLEAVTPAQMRRLMKALMEKAINGDVAAARLVLERCIGTALPVDILERLSLLETILGEKQNAN